MGVTGLYKLIADEVPSAIKDNELKSYFGRRIAVDASMSLYQFLIAIRFSTQQLANNDGETTSHLNGFFFRTAKLLENGIKPVFVFDGKPPDMKLETLRSRREKAEEAQFTLSQLDGNDTNESNDDDYEDVVVTNKEEELKLSKRTVRMTSEHVESAKKLLKLMGVPVIEAPSEAEAQCAQLAKEGLVYGVATEDIDALTFGSPKMIRHMTSAANERIKEIDLQIVLDGLGISQEQLIDLCILIGCDYCPSVRGIGPKKGLKFLKKCGTIEDILVEMYGFQPDSSDSGSDSDDTTVVGVKFSSSGSDTETESVDVSKVSKSPKKGTKAKKKVTKAKSSKVSKSKKPIKDKTKDVPLDWQYKEARKLYLEPNVIKSGTIKESDLKIKDVDEEGLIEFLCKKNQFDEERVRAAIKRIQDSKPKSSQTRLDSFFKVSYRAPTGSQSSALSQKSIKQASSSQSSALSQKSLKAPSKASSSLSSAPKSIKPLPQTPPKPSSQASSSQTSPKPKSADEESIKAPIARTPTKKKIVKKKKIPKVKVFNTNGGKKIIPVKKDDAN